MANECLAAIHLCRVRATRLNLDGTPTPGPNNVYITDKPMVLSVTPTIEAGQDRTLVGGCDCIIATYKGPDKLKRFEFEFDIGVLEAGLLEMLLGSSAILDGSDIIGNWWTQQAFDCSSGVQPNICLEAWQTGWSDDQQDPVWPYVRWIWPSTYWQIGAHSLQNDFTQPKLHGFSRGNTSWGVGIFHDQPEAAEPMGGWFYDDTIPTASCGYATHSIT